MLVEKDSFTVIEVAKLAMSGSKHQNTSETDPLLAGQNDKANITFGAVENGIAAISKDDIEDEVVSSKELTISQLLLTQSGLWLCCFLAALDTTIIATLSVPISASFDSFSLLSWLAAAYLIANAALQPISGRLTDILSRRTGLIFANTFFALGNLICGLAQDQWLMILGRVVAGLGGGCLTAISTFVISDLIPLRKRGVWQGIMNVFFAVGASLGGVLGGWINDKWDWRIAFLAQVPMTMVAGTLIFFTIKIPVTQRAAESAWRRIDFLGASTLICSLVLLLLGLNSGGNTVPWIHPLVLTAFSLSAIFLVIFIYVETHYAIEPVIPVKLLLNRSVLSVCLTNWFISMCVYALLFYCPIYFQVKGLTPTQAGVRLVPFTVSNGIGSMASGLIMGWTGRYYLLNVSGLIMFLIGVILFSTFTLTTPGFESIIAFFLCGVGYSSMLTTTLVALISAVDFKHQAVITSTSYAFRSLGSTIGITIASAVFQNILDMQLNHRLRGMPDAADVIQGLRDSLAAIHEVPSEWRSNVTMAYMDALQGVFLTTLGIGVLGLLASLGIREHTLHSTMARK